MNDKIFDVYPDQSDRFLTPIREFNKLAVAQFEKLAALQMASLQEYTTIGLAQMKSVSAVQDIGGVQDYLAQQNEVLKNVGEKFAADARALMELSKEFGDEAQQIARDSMASVTRNAA